MNKGLKELLISATESWNNWQWQMKQKSVSSDISQLATLGITNKNVKQAKRVGLTPYNVKLLLSLKETDEKAYKAEILQSFLPFSENTKKHQWSWALRRDFLSEKVSKFLPKFIKTLFFGNGSDTETQALENIYPQTDVVIATATCARHCSFCFREVGNWQGEASQFTGDMNTIMNAVSEVVKRKKPHVLITGGDPLTRSNLQLQQLLSPLVESDSIEVLRLATRMVVDLPMRFYDKELLTILTNLSEKMKRRGASFRIVTQVNHVCEITPEAIKAIKNIQACGIEILNQTVVLKGVNDSVETLQKVLMTLDRLGIRNHKLFCAMPVSGTEHMRISIRKFRKLLAGLHQWIPGTSVPQGNIATLVGKIPISPIGRWILPIPFTNRLLTRSFRGEWFIFKDVWEAGRIIKETIILSVICLLIFFSISMFDKIENTQIVENHHITLVKTIHMIEVMQYPDYMFRHFQPFVDVNGVLYEP